ncbi:alpha-1-acid glycoprotein 1 [Otolemur garnettii]|nr:alpha-1-acid glycoprotein 1 [Otolemur garnettii]
MALPWVLAVLSLLPLMDAHSPLCANLTAVPITNASLDRISGKRFYIASALRDPEYKKASMEISADFFYLAPNKTEDKIELREYQTIKDKCVYNFSYLNVQRENGTISKYEGGKEHYAQLVLLKDPKIFIFAFFLEDEQNRGLTFYADKPEATEEQLEEFYEMLACAGMLKSEVVYTDIKKDACEPLEKQHKKEEEERRKEKDSKEDTASGQDLGDAARPS